MRRTILLVSLFALLLPACDEGDDAKASPSPSTSASPSTEGSIADTALADLEGTWIGELVEPAVRHTYSFRIRFGRCDLGDGEGCADWKATTQNWSESSGISENCEGTLSYLRIEGSAFMFQETIESGSCYPSTLAVVPMPGDPFAIGVEEYAEGRWYTFGALLNKNNYFGYP